MQTYIESDTWSFMIAMRGDTMSTMLDPWACAEACQNNGGPGITETFAESTW